MKNFCTTSDYSILELEKIIDLAINLKKGEVGRSLPGKIMTMLFFNPSLRTRLSFITAMEKLGGKAVDFPLSSAYPMEFETGAVMDKGNIEHAKDAAKVISRYSSVIGVRASELVTTGAASVEVSSWSQLKKDTVINSFIKYASVPVVNMESNIYHPCQGLADAMTIKEKLGDPQGGKYVLTWVPHPKALPMATPNSQILSACELGMDVTVVYPHGWELDQDIMKAAQKRSKQAGGSLSLTHNQFQALQGAQIVTAKSWGALKYYGNWNEEKKLREKFTGWIIDKEKMKASDKAFFMHCLPIRRNVEATDEVLDSPDSLIYEEAENRQWAQMAILLYLLDK